MTAIALALLVQATAPDEHLRALRRALEATAAKPYAYQVRGRFERSGEWAPPDVLSSRMKQYQSARKGDLILVKGPEGLWKTPEERLGEQVEKPDPDAADIVRTLSGAEPAHRIVGRLLDEVEKGREPEDREVDGLPCRRYQLYYPAPGLRDALQKQLDKAVQSGGLPKPDEIRWASSLKGTLRIYVSKADGRLVKAVEERSVKIAYKVPESAPEVKAYRLEMEVEVIDWGKAAVQLPAEIRAKLGMQD
jgi:hypothetical protein